MIKYLTITVSLLLIWGCSNTPLEETSTLERNDQSSSSGSEKLISSQILEKVVVCKPYDIKIESDEIVTLPVDYGLPVSIQLDQLKDQVDPPRRYHPSKGDGKVAEVELDQIKLTRSWEVGRKNLEFLVVSVVIPLTNDNLHWLSLACQANVEYNLDFPNEGKVYGNDAILVVNSQLDPPRHQTEKEESSPWRNATFRELLAFLKYQAYAKVKNTSGRLHALSSPTEEFASVGFSSFAYSIVWLNKSKLDNYYSSGHDTNLLLLVREKKPPAVR